MFSNFKSNLALPPRPGLAAAMNELSCSRRRAQRPVVPGHNPVVPCHHPVVSSRPDGHVPCHLTGHRDVLSCWQLPSPSPASVSPGLWTRPGDRDAPGEMMHGGTDRQGTGVAQGGAQAERRWVAEEHMQQVGGHRQRYPDGRHPIAREVADRDGGGPTRCCPGDAIMERIQQPQQLAALIFMAVLAGKRLTLYVLPFSLNGTVIYPLTHVTCRRSRFPGAPRPADIPTHHRHAPGCTERGAWGHRGMARPPPHLVTPNWGHRWLGAVGSRAPQVSVPPCLSHSPRPCPV